MDGTEEADEFIGKLQSIREGRTLVEMSAETGIGMPTLSRILNQNRQPSYRIMVKLLKAYPRLAESFWDGKRVVRG